MLPSIPAGLSNGDTFRAEPLDESFNNLRRVLNSTVGSHGQPWGKNIPADAASIGARSMQQGCSLEVARSDPNITGPENFTAKDYAAAAGSWYPWGGKSNEEQPAGASVTFANKEPCKGLIIASVAMDRSFNDHIGSQAVYVTHRVSATLQLLLTHPSGATSLIDNFGESLRTQHDDTALALGGDTGQASGLTVWAVLNLPEVGTYSASTVLFLNLIASQGTVVNSLVSVSQQLGSGSSMSVFLFNR